MRHRWIPGHDRSKKLNRPKIIAELLRGIEIRGRHATGYAFHDGDESTVIYKAAVRARDFVSKAPLFTEAFEQAPRVMLLHTRYATQGSPNDNRNNHPIYSKITGLTLIHNGWLTNEAKILETFDLQKDGAVDSETILRLIEHFMLNEKKRLPAAIKLAMGLLEGRFACALMAEKHPDTLFLWTKGNPLAGYRDERNGAFYFASTPEILEHSLRRAEIHAPEIGALSDGRLLCLSVVKGRFKGKFFKLEARKKRHEPLKHRHPLIGMPLHREPAKAGWEMWKEQGRKIKKLLES